MEIFLAGVESYLSLIDGYNFNILMSYYYISSQMNTIMSKYDFNNQKLILDSGAFTAWTKGKQIDVDKYISFVNKYDDILYLFGQVDKIPGDIKHGHTQEQVEESARETWENYLYMRKRVKSPHKLLYTYHVGEPVEFLKQALDWKDENNDYIPYIALGGLVGKSSIIRNDFLEMCFNVIKKSNNSNVKVHAFGMTSPNLLKKFPITSADSTTWLRGGKFGEIMTFYGNIPISDKRNDSITHIEQLKVLQSLTMEKGFDIEVLRVDWNQRILYNALFLQDLTEYIKKTELHLTSQTLYFKGGKIMKKALVLSSGGIDSTTCLGLAVNNLGKDNVSTLSIVYGQKHNKETEQSLKISKYYGVNHYSLDLTEIFKCSNSVLLSHNNTTIEEGSYENQISKNGIVSTYIPFRNGLFVSVLASFGMSLYPDNSIDIYLGIHKDDNIRAYADCTQEFAIALNKAIQYGTYNKVQLQTPFVNLNKSDIVSLGISLKVPYELTWSCYNGKEKACGRCATCIDRLKAFELNNIKDLIQYE